MKKYGLLIIALVLGSFLRLWELSSVPNGLTWDEAAIGYNAYSILKTGRDEHGAFLPIIFKSFGDYKPGAYIYLTVPSIAIFGLNEFAVRFPSALAGIIAILGIYLFTKELFKKTNLANFAALSLAVSPWHVHFGHSAWEVNIFSTLLLFGLYYFLRFINGRSTLYPSLFLACLSLAMYQAAKLLTPLIFILFILIYWKQFWSNFSLYLKPFKFLLLVPFLIFIFWIFFGTFFGSAGNRLSTLSIFNYKPGISAETKKIDGLNSTLTNLFHNQTQLTSSLVFSRYVYHFSPEVLFYEGSIITERGHIPGLGVLNPLEFLWLILGLAWVVRNLNKSSLIVLSLILISPIPASLTLAEFSTIRALFMVIPLSILSGMGVLFALERFRWFSLPLIFVYVLTTTYVFDIYFYHSKVVFAKEFNYGYKQVIQIIKENPASKVVFTDVYGQPYIYYLFYTAYDPEVYQKNVDFIDGGLDVGRVGHVGNVEFHQFGADEMMTQKDTLFIGSEGNINNKFDLAGPTVDLFRQIESPDRKIIFRVIKTKS
jgi:4-amino-4-deoxy-L-arabinose transferase-like glycosyltransferase